MENKSVIDAQHMADLSKWFVSGLGRELVEQERAHIAIEIESLFGHYILQIGNILGVDLLTSSSIRHKILLLEGLLTQQNHMYTSLRTSVLSLPIKSDSIDVIVLPHILEFAPQPHQVLREVERVLIGDGCVLITGFNPLSLWGVNRMFAKWHNKAPWNGNFFRLGQMMDWLSALNFEIQKTNTFYWSLPLQHDIWRYRCRWMLPFTRFFGGGLFLIVARKRCVPPTMIKLNWDLAKIAAMEVPLDVSS